MEGFIFSFEFSVVSESFCSKGVLIRASLDSAYRLAVCLCGFPCLI